MPDEPKTPEVNPEPTSQDAAPDSKPTPTNLKLAAPDLKSKASDLKSAAPDPQHGWDPVSSFHAEIREAVELLDFAVRSGRTVDDTVVDRIKTGAGYLKDDVFPSDADRATFEKAYRDLAIFMKPVTIETLRCTRDGYWGSSRRSLSKSLFGTSSDARLFSKKLWAWVLFAAVIIVVLQTCYDTFAVDEETAGRPFALALLFLKPLNPFFYGLLGALAYLLRSAHSYIADRTFDMKRVPEYYNRMLLGFLGGGVVLLFVDPKSFNVSEGAIAFIVGYNTDYLFDTIERLAGSIFPKVNLTVTPKDGTTATAKPGVAKLQIAAAANGSKQVTAGGNGNATVTLNGPAPTEGVTVALQAAPPGITVPQTVLIAAGGTSAQFTFSVQAGTATGTQGTITGSANATSASDTFTVA